MTAPTRCRCSPWLRGNDKDYNVPFSRQSVWLYNPSRLLQEGEEAEHGVGGGAARCGGGGRSQSGEKEEGEVGDHGEEEEGDGERFKFWVKVDIFRAAD